MTDNNHPITVSAGSITGWKTLYRETYQGDLSETEYIATQATRWGADQELEACCEVLTRELICDGKHVATDLRNVRRPQPPSLKEQALGLIDGNSPYLDGAAMSIIRQALESLPS